MGEHVHIAGKTSKADSAASDGVRAQVAPEAALDAGVLLFSPDMRLEFASPTAFEILGCEDSAELAERLRELLPPLAPRTAAFAEFETPPKGSQARLLWRIEPAVAAAREWHVVLVRHAGPDAARERVLTMAARFANRARIDPVMLHDLRAPMNALALELELLKLSLPSDRAEQGELPERVRSIEKSFDRFKQAWESFARHGANRDESSATFAIADLFAEARAPLESLARRRRVALEVRAPDRSALVAGRRDLLAQALLSIAIHRLEAVPAGGHLSLEAQVERERLQILLSDTGAHAQPAELGCFFDPRLAGANDDAALSLYVARSIVLAHRGSFDVEATADGTRVTIELAVLPPTASTVA